MTSSISILLIDDHAMFRTGLRMVLNSSIPASTIFEAGTLNEAIISSVNVLDVVLLDIKLKGLSGLEGISLLKRRWPLVPVLMLSSQDEPGSVDLSLARGAAGFISKAEPVEKMIDAIQLVLRGGFPALSPSVNGPMVKCLTPRQCEVLDLLHKGLSNKQIARQLLLSDNTVRRHVQDILEYFQVASRAEAVFAARNLGLLG